MTPERSVLDAAIAVARSEIGVMNMKAGAGIDHDPWPEMDELVKLLDRVAPGWEAPPEPPPARLPTNLRCKLRVANVAAPGLGSPCWEWIGRLNRNGYGRIRHRGREPVAHRAVYEELVGPIKAKLVLDHRCRMRACCNPAHLEPVTARTNTRRGEAVLFQCSPAGRKAAHA